jgi:hypothetical protein
MDFFLNQGKKLIGTLSNIKIPEFNQQQQQNLQDQIKKLKQPFVKINPMDMKLPGELQDKIKLLIKQPLDDDKKKMLQDQLVKLKDSPTQYKEIYKTVEKHLPGQLESKFKALMSKELIDKQMIENLQSKFYKLMKLPHLDKQMLSNLLENVNKLQHQPVLYKQALEKINTKFDMLQVPNKDDVESIAKLNADILKLIKPIKKLSPILSKSQQKSKSSSNHIPLRQPQRQYQRQLQYQLDRQNQRQLQQFKSPSPEKRVRNVKTCPEGKELNRLTGRCNKIKEVKPKVVKEVKPKVVKEVKPKAVKEVKPKAVKEVKPKAVKEVKPKAVKEVKPKTVKEVKPKAVKEVKPLLSGYEMINGKMYKKCKEGQIRNANMRCVKIK